MWKGTSPDGSHYYPVFPYTSYQQMKLEDVRDLFAYLKTLPAVQGRVRDHDLPIHFKIRRTLGGMEIPVPRWPAVQARPVEIGAVESRRLPGQRAEPLRGVPQPAQSLGGIIASQRFAGGPDPEGGDGWVPNITQAGIGDYSERDIERVLESGDMPNGDSVGGVDGQVVGNMSQLAAAGSRRDRRLHQIAAAGRGTEEALNGR